MEGNLALLHKLMSQIRFVSEYTKIVVIYPSIKQHNLNNIICIKSFKYSEVIQRVVNLFFG